MAKRERINLSNDISVRNLKWKQGDPNQFRVRDQDRMGLYIRVTRHGKKTWEYRYPISQEKYRYLVLGHYPKTGCAEALSLYEDYREQVKDYGKDPKEFISTNTLSLSELFDDHYIPRYAKVKKKTWQEDADIYDLHVRGLIGNKSAKHVSASDIEKVLGQLELAKKLHTARKTRAVLNKMFNWATSRASAIQPGSGPILDIQNPCNDVTVQKPELSEKHALKHDEIRKIWNHLDPQRNVDRIMMLLILTGSRVSEICELHSNEIDWNAKQIILQPHRTRNKRLHVIPLTTHMEDIIGPNNNDFIFPARSKSGHTTDSGVRIALNKYCKELEIEHTSPHDFRDTFISLAAEIGIPREIRNRLTNHADLSVDGIHYNAYEYRSEKFDALLQWSRKLVQILAQGG